MAINNPPKIDKSKDNSFTIQLTLSQVDIAQEFEHQLTHIQRHFHHQGFRPGNVPLSIVRSNVDTPKVLEEVASTLISRVYQQIVKDNQLKPVVNPQVVIKNQPLSLTTDWQVEIQSAQLPQIKIDPTYLSQIKKLKSKELEPIFQIIIKSSTLSLPPILINSELQQRLASLAESLQSAKLTFEKYLQLKKLTQEELVKHLIQDITQEWTLNLAITQIAKDQKIEVTPDELDKLYQQNPRLAQNPSLTSYLQLQQKVIDFLKKL